MSGKAKRGGGTGVAPATVRSAKLLANGTDQSFRQLIYDLHSIAAFLSKTSAKFSDHMGLPASQHHILRVIAERELDNPVNVNKVAEVLNMNQTQVTRELNELVRLEMVKKTRDSQDRRQINLSVTSRGRQMLQDVAPVLREINEALFADITKKEFQVLCAIVRKLAGNSEPALMVAEWMKSGRAKDALPAGVNRAA